MFGTLWFVSKSRLQKYIGVWNSLYSFFSYRPFSKQAVTHLSLIIALNSRFRLEKVYKYGQGEVRPKKWIHREPEVMSS